MGESKIGNQDKMDAVIVDTNSVHSNSYDTLLGSRNELIEVSKHATLLIPDIVLEELICQRRRRYNDEMSNLEKNGILSLCKKSSEVVARVSFESIRDTLLSDQSIPYDKIYLQDPIGALEKCRKLALDQLPPFKENGSGFKDALIALTIEQFIKTRGHETNTYFVCADKQLANYFDDAEGLIICTDIKDLLMIMKAGPDKSSNTGASNAASVNNQYGRSEIEEAITIAESARSFVSAHSAIARLSKMLGALTDDDKKRLLLLSVQNDQIYQILTDHDLFDFFFPLFEEYQDSLSEAQKALFQKKADLLQVKTPSGRFAFFSSENVNCYRRFSEELAAHIVAIDSKAAISRDAEDILKKLGDTLSDCGLEEYVPDSGTVLSSFISGNYRYRPKGMDVAILRDFVALMNDSSRDNRDVVVDNIAAMLDSKKDYSHSYYPDEEEIPF